jgi:hypothetical protein
MILGTYEISLDELEAMPDIEEGYTCDLKIDNGDERIWLARTGIDDGEECDNKVTVERLVNGRWIEDELWEAK